MSAIIEETCNNNLMPRIVLIACGSFSPPTPMHFRMFEIARDYFEMQGTYSVVGGIVSPTHDSYGKKGLVSGKHRCVMTKLALQSSSWIRVSEWEIAQPHWLRTKAVLQYHQNYMNNFINSSGHDQGSGHLPGWLPTSLSERGDHVQLKLLCGADLLESFSVPGLWSNEDIEDIVANHGLVVISRSGANPEKFIFDSDILTKFQRNINLITNWVPNDVSSTMIRRLIRRGQSVKYLIDDLVMEYIKKHDLFECKSKYMNALRTPSQNVGSIEFSNQVNMMTSSNDNTPSDDDDGGVNEEHMDDADNSIKNILTSINLDNRKVSKVFCCGETERKLQLIQRSGPGQVVQVITTEKGTTERVLSAVDEVQAKKMKISSGQNV